MKKSILSIAAVALLGLFITACTPEVVINGTSDIIVDLGATDADVLANVSASNDDEVTVTGINYDEAGPQLATFKTGDITKDDTVKVKTDKLAGNYEYTVSGDATVKNSTITQSTTVYNKILIDGFLDDASIDVFCNGNIITVYSTNITNSGVKGTMTGTGTFEKVGSIFQVKTLTLTTIWEDSEDPDIAILTFTKK